MLISDFDFHMSRRARAAKRSGYSAGIVVQSVIIQVPCIGHDRAIRIVRSRGIQSDGGPFIGEVMAAGVGDGPNEKVDVVDANFWVEGVCRVNLQFECVYPARKRRDVDPGVDSEAAGFLGKIFGDPNW